MSAKGFEHRSGGFYYIDGLQTAMSGAIRGTGQQKKGARICVPWLTDRIEPQKKSPFPIPSNTKVGWVYRDSCEMRFDTTYHQR